MLIDKKKSNLETSLIERTGSHLFFFFFVVLYQISSVEKTVEEFYGGSINSYM